MTESRDRLFAPARLGPIELPNRVIKCATYETRSSAGLVTDELIEWHREFAAGGVGMTTLAYCSVASDGRTFRDQIWLRDEALPGLRRFSEAMHHEGARAAIQLGHAGWFADPKATGTKPLGPSRMFSPHSQTFSRAMGAEDFERLRDDFARAARLSVEAGFDALEIHLGHGYLLSQFLSPYNNRRSDEWGDSLEARARFPRQIVEIVRKAAGPDVAIYAKLNMDDGFAGGLELHEGIQVARWLEADGCLDAIQLTGGHTTKSPMYLMRGDSPLGELFGSDPNRIRGLAMRLIASLITRNWSFEEAFFLAQASQFRAQLQIPLMLLGGLNRLETLERAMHEGFEFVALGRALIRQPDLINLMKTGTSDDSECTHCNSCVARVGLSPTICPLRNEDPGAATAST